MGSTVTSLIYAPFTFLFFAIEAAILTSMLNVVFRLPLPVGYVLCTLAVVPLVTHGITFISRFQLWTQPAWIVLHLLPFAFIAFQGPAARRKSIGIVRRSGEHLTGLIEGLLDISKIEAGRIELYRDEVRLPEFLGQIANMFRLQAAAKGLDFVFTLPASVPAVIYTDERRLRQILINLLSNAVKFTMDGTVSLRVSWRGAIAEIEVADTDSSFTIRLMLPEVMQHLPPVVRAGMPGAPARLWSWTTTRSTERCCGRCRGRSASSCYRPTMGRAAWSLRHTCSPTCS